MDDVDEVVAGLPLEEDLEGDGGRGGVVEDGGV